MSTYTILAWQPLLRPPLPDQEPPMVPQIPLKALACRNSTVAMAALITSDRPVDSARVVYSDLMSGANVIRESAIRTRLVGTVKTPEVGGVCDPLFDVEEFAIDKSTSLCIGVRVPKDVPAGLYTGSISLIIDGEEVAHNGIALEVANAVLPDVRDWAFFLNVWMNPAAIARGHNTPLWSDEHFEALRPYIADLAAHGQKTVVAPICYQPWGSRTRDPYPNLIAWTRRGDDYEFDFTAFDRYVGLHAECGIDKSIHCYSIVQIPFNSDVSTIEYTDADTGETRLIETHVGDDQYVKAWGSFFAAFADHLNARGWMPKTHVAFPVKPEEVMGRLVDFLSRHARGFRIGVTSNTTNEVYESAEDMTVEIGFDKKGVTDTIPPSRSAMGVAELLDPTCFCSTTRKCPEKTSTTFFVCCAPEHPNTFVHSPLVESRALPFLVLQGGFDGFVRWAYNDWPDNPFENPAWGDWPTGDTFLVYPRRNGPVSSLRWEQLREGIQDYELAMIALANIRTADEMVDYEQAVTLACRDLDGGAKSIGDIEIARRLLIPIAEHQEEL